MEQKQEEKADGPCSAECACSSESSATTAPPGALSACACPQDLHGLVVHERACLQYNSAYYIYPPTAVADEEKDDDLLSLESEIAKLGVCACGQPAAACTCRKARYRTEDENICLCCKYPVYKCKCDAEQKEAFHKWRTNRPIKEAMPPVLEASHPLMQKFQETLKRFLEKENAIAQEEILNLTDELKLQRNKYDADLETIYRHDHDTNQQRILIEEYEQTLADTVKERQAQEVKTNEAIARHKAMKERLNQDIVNEREVKEELEALSLLTQQLEEWRRETESELTISQRMSDKMRRERKERADEKRQLDIIIYRLNTEVWRLESDMGLYREQMKIKNEELEEVRDRIATYNAELEDLQLEQKRLISLWNSVLVNIAHRDKVFNSVKDDYSTLQNNYRTLLSNLEATKKATAAEMTRGQAIAMNKDKMLYDIAAATKLYDTEEAKRLEYETQLAQLNEAAEMTEKDQELVRNENYNLEKILRNSKREYEKKVEVKMNIENEMLEILQDCVLNDKAVNAMVQGIRRMREMAKKQELNLTQMENNHAKVMLDIEMMKVKQKENQALEAAESEKLEARERELQKLEDQIEQNNQQIMRKQRDLDIEQKKSAELVEKFNSKTPQENRVEELEQQIAELRCRTEVLQQDWLRLQSHVVRLTQQHHKQISDISLIQKQIQICDHALVRLEHESEACRQAHDSVDRSLRALRGRLEVLERARKEHADLNKDTQRANMTLTHEYTANLKEAEAELMQVEEDISNLEDEKDNLVGELDKTQKEALIWQRKGILAVELKRNMNAAKSATGEIYKMKSEIHKMTIRREQLKRIGEKLSSDLALCITRRDTVLEKVRATEAVVKSSGGTHTTSQAQYKHKLRLAKGDVHRVTKDIESSQDRLEMLAREEQRLLSDIATTTQLNNSMEERIATLQRETIQADVDKQWFLERVVRKQRLGTELKNVIKKQSIKLSKSESAITYEHDQLRAFNDSLRDIVATVISDYPYVEDKLKPVLNTLKLPDPLDTPLQSPSYNSTICECD